MYEERKKREKEQEEMKRLEDVEKQKNIIARAKIVWKRKSKT